MKNNFLCKAKPKKRKKFFEINARNTKMVFKKGKH